MERNGALALAKPLTDRPVPLPTTPSAWPARLLAQAPVMIDLACALAIWAVDIGRMQAMGADRVLEVELAHVGMDDVETLIAQQRAKRKT